MINIPNQSVKQWNQANQSDLFGNIHITKNITFDIEGYLKLSFSSRAAMDEGVDANFDNPTNFLFTEDYGYFTPTWDNAFQVNADSTAGPLSVRPTQISTAGVPSTDIEGDAVWFGGLLPVSQDTDLDYYDPVANSWTDTNITLTANGQHQIVNFLSLSALAVVNVNTIGLYASPLTATPTLITTLVISADFEITSAVYFNQNLYIATNNVYGGNAFLYVWNGLGTAANQVYEVKSPIILSMCVHQEAVYLTVGNGSLLRFNGGSFDFVDAFPIYYQNQAMIKSSGALTMYKNTMTSNGSLLYILMSNQGNDANRLLSQPDGVWCYDKDVGLYHRYAVSNALVSIQSTSTVDVSTNQITVTSAPITGTEVVFTQVFGLTPLINGNKYFVIKIDSTHIQLSTTLANAVAGVPIDLLVSSGSNTYTFFPNVDFGQYFCGRTTAINIMDVAIENPLYGTEMLWGGEVQRRDNTADYSTMGVASKGVEARGYFITPKVFSDEVTDTMNLVTLKFSPFTSENDKILVKYRIIDDMREYIKLSDWAMIWTSTTQFTTTFSDWGNAVVGDEVEVLKGGGAGILGHITSIVLDTGTYTVTIDESYANYTSGDRGTAVFRNWKKWKTITYGDSNALQYFLSDQLGVNGKFIQLKVELRGNSTTVEELLIDNKYRLSAKIE